MVSLFVQSRLNICCQRPQFANRARSKSSGSESRARSKSSSSESQRSHSRNNDSDDESRIPCPTVSDGDSEDDLQPRSKSHYRTPAVPKKVMKTTKGMPSKRQVKREQEVSVLFAFEITQC